MHEEIRQLLKKYDRLIDKEYARADMKRKMQMRRGKRPTHRSIDEHFKRNIKDKKLTVPIEVAKRLKKQKELKIARMKLKQKK